MVKKTLKNAQAKFDKLCSQKNDLLVEAAKRKIESAKLTIEAAKLAGKFKEVNINSMPRCW